MAVRISRISFVTVVEPIGGLVCWLMYSIHLVLNNPVNAAFQLISSCNELLIVPWSRKDRSWEVMYDSSVGCIPSL